MSAAEKLGEIGAHPVARLVALFDAVFDLVAFLGAFADITREFEMEALGQAEILHQHLDLLQHLAHGFAGDRVFHVLELDLGAGGRVEAGLRAGLGIDQATRQMRQQPARGFGRDVTGAAESVEFARFGAFDQRLGDGGVDRQSPDAGAEGAEIGAEGEDRGQRIERFRLAEQGLPSRLAHRVTHHLADRVTPLRRVARARHEIVLLVLGRNLGEAD